MRTGTRTISIFVIFYVHQYVFTQLTLSFLINISIYFDKNTTDSTVSVSLLFLKLWPNISRAKTSEMERDWQNSRCCNLRFSNLKPLFPQTKSPFLRCASIQYITTSSPSQIFFFFLQTLKFGCTP